MIKVQTGFVKGMPELPESAVVAVESPFHGKNKSGRIVRLKNGADAGSGHTKRQRDPELDALTCFKTSVNRLEKRVAGIE